MHTARIKITTKKVTLLSPNITPLLQSREEGVWKKILHFAHDI
jgi:hypothetical protein